MANHEYNLEVAAGFSPGKLEAYIKQMGLKVIERWKAGDVNVSISDDMIDDVTEWCEANNIKCDLVS